MYECLSLLSGNTNKTMKCGTDPLILGSGSWSDIQSTLVISNSKGHSKILRDIRTSTYQISRLEEKII